VLVEIMCLHGTAAGHASDGLDKRLGMVHYALAKLSYDPREPDIQNGEYTCISMARHINVTKESSSRLKKAPFADQNPSQGGKITEAQAATQTLLGKRQRGLYETLQTLASKRWEPCKRTGKHGFVHVKLPSGAYPSAAQAASAVIEPMHVTPRRAPCTQT
tara:strand:+ start:137 stop:619 length:483 start_codon:yes stop_codon:yes gene_type:complete